MATCCFLTDKEGNILITKRPDHLRIFPRVWTLPGGITDYGETLEDSAFRKIEDDLGITMEFTDEEDPLCNTF